METLRRQAPVLINDIDIGVYGFQRRRLFDALAPAEASDLLPDEIEELLPDVYAAIAAEADGPVFLKSHDRLCKTRSGRWLFPPESVKSAIYLTRHPFDVAVSYAHHRGITVAEASALMADEGHVIAAAATALPMHLSERLGSWSGNVASWLDGAPYAVTHVRYEDLYAEPMVHFSRIAMAAGLTGVDEYLPHAIEVTRFDRLQREEREQGFRERPRSSPRFFREGRPGSWIGQLDEPSRRSLVRAHAQTMARLGYGLDAGK